MTAAEAVRLKEELAKFPNINPATEDVFIDDRPVTTQELREISYLDVQRVEIIRTPGRDRIIFHLAAAPRPGGTFRILFDATSVDPVMRVAPGPVAGVPSPRALVAAAATLLAPPVAQGSSTPVTGPNFREDVVIVGQLDSGGGTVTAITGGSQRPVPGATIRTTEQTVVLEIPDAALIALGVARAGVRVIFASQGPAPQRAYDRVPQRGFLVLGLRGRDGVDASWIRTRIDLNGDRRDDIFYLDANRNGMIDSAALDRNGDGRISFMDAEGPFVLANQAGRAVEFQQVERRQSGRLTALVLVNSEYLYVTFVEDRNGNGRLEAGEFTAYTVLRR